MSKINVRDRELRYYFINEEYQDGKSPLLVFLHDGLGSIGQWKDLPETLSEETDLPALVYDRHGHGGATPLTHARDKNYMQEEAFEVLPELLEKLEVREPIVSIGHSDGGSIALLHGAHAPRKVASIVSIAAHVFVEQVTIDGIRNTVREFENGRLREHLKQYHTRNTDPMFYGWSNLWLSEAFQDWNIEKDIEGVTAPTLLIQGEEDPYGSWEQVEAIAKAISGEKETFPVPGAGHQPHLPGAGHQPHHEKPEEVTQKIVRFLQTRVMEPKQG